MTRRPLAPVAAEAAARTVRRWSIAPTARAAVLLAIGLLWLVPAWIDRRAIGLMAAWNLIVIGVLVLDAFQLPPARALRITRRWSGAVTLGSAVTVSLTLRNESSRPIRAALTDHLGPALGPEPGRGVVRVDPGGEATATYEVIARERGDRAAGEVLIEWRSVWGLAERWAQAPLDQTVRVYPNVHESRRHSMYLIRSRQIALEKRRARRAMGGREFDRLREYRAGDERRDVSWAVSARRARLVTKIYQPERSQTVWILVDAGRLLRARTGGQTLLDRAATAALALTEVALASGDNVGFVAYGRRIQHRLAPARGPAHLRAVLEALATVRAEAIEANHAAAVAALAAGQRRRALVVWLTDVAETAGVPDVIEHATSLAPRHVVLFAAMRQPELAAAVAAAPATASEMYRVLTAQEAMERREALLHGLRQRGATIVETSPEALSGGLVDAYLEVKERGLV